MNAHIVIAGNPATGFRFFGPFPDEEAARQFIDDDNAPLNGEEAYSIAPLRNVH